MKEKRVFSRSTRKIRQRCRRTRPGTSTATTNHRWPSDRQAVQAGNFSVRRSAHGGIGPQGNGVRARRNGAAMSIGRTSSFLDIYIERDLKEGALDEAAARELWDQRVQKLRIVRFLRTPDYDSLFSVDPDWATECVGGIGSRRPGAGDQEQLPHAQHALHSRPGPGTEHHRVVVQPPAGRFQALLRQGQPRRRRCSMRMTV
jgi:hypothetical protein